MAGASEARTIRRRIKSVRNTQQITRAMKMVSAAKLRRAQDRAERTGIYYNGLVRMMGDLALYAPSLTHIYLTGDPQADKSRIILILITSDKGLCGSYNANILKKYEQFRIANPDKKIELICIGKKGYDFSRKRGFKIIDYLSGFGREIKLDDIQPLNEKVRTLYEKGEIAEVYLIYAKFVNIVRNIPTLVRILPVPIPEFDDVELKKERIGEFLIEPSGEELLYFLLPRYFEVSIFHPLTESFASEHSSRMVAMDNATKAADDMIETLTMFYNKARQAGITSELLDIVGGAEALKSGQG